VAIDPFCVSASLRYYEQFAAAAARHDRPHGLLAIVEPSEPKRRRWFSDDR